MAKGTSKFKTGRHKFYCMGRVKLNGKYQGIDIDIISEKSGYIYSKLNMGMDTGYGNSINLEIMSGYFPTGSTYVDGTPKITFLYLNKEKFGDGNVKVDFNDRNNATIIEQLGLAKSNYKKCGVEFDSKGKLNIEEFLSEYDMLDYAKDKLKDGDIVKISGIIKPNFYKGEVKNKFNITNIYKQSNTFWDSKINKLNEDGIAKRDLLVTKLTEKSIENDTELVLPEEYKNIIIDDYFYSNFTETLYFLNDGISRKLRGETSTPILAYKMAYIDKKTGSKMIPMKYEFEKESLSKYLTAKRGKVTSVTVDGSIINKTKTKELKFEELDETVQELVNDGLMDKATAIGKATVYGGYESKMLINTPHFDTSNKDGVNTQKVLIDKDMAEEKELLDIILKMDTPKEVELSDEIDKEEIKNLSEDVDEKLEDILDGLDDL